MTTIEAILSILKGMLNNYYNVVTGNTGKNTNISNTSVNTGDWVAVQMISSNVAISSITIDDVVYTGWSAITQAQGNIIYGKITSITLSAGTVRMYGNIKQTV